MGDDFDDRDIVSPGYSVALVDCGHVDRPSPGDDITHAAFDAMDREGS